VSLPRLITFLVGISLFFLALTGYLFQIQVLKSEELSFMAGLQQTAKERVKANRGLIYDRNKTLMVYNSDDYSFYADVRITRKNKKDSLIAAKFSEIVGKPFSHYYGILKKGKKIVPVEKKVDAKTALKLKELSIEGLFYEEDPTRVYPYQATAAHILGYVNKSESGESGIESKFNSVLKGTDGQRLIARDAIGRRLYVIDETTNPVENGQNIVLTIDKNLQSILQEELKKGVDSLKAEYGVGIVLDPNTGEILALSSMPDFDPNNYSKFDEIARRNRVVTDVYEPGSTFKTVALSVFLDQGLTNVEEMIYTDNGKYKFITDSHKSGWLSVREVFTHSSNIGMAKISERIDDDEFFTRLRGFGFGNTTNIELPGEVGGYLSKPNIWSESSKYTFSYGYGVSVTPLQIAAAYSAIVNGGTLYEPHIIKRIEDENGNVISEFSPKAIRKVLKESSSAIMRDLLIAAVNEGTGKKARINNIVVGGKTGTARKIVNGSYSMSEYNASFAGFFPADKPKYVCLIVVSSPRGVIYGGEVAAPIFRRVFDRMVDFIPELRDKKREALEKEEKLPIHLASNSEQSQNSVHLTYNTPLNSTQRNVMPNLIGRSVRSSAAYLAKVGVQYKIVGSGRVISQSVEPGERIDKASTVVLKAEESKIIGTVLY